MQHNSTSIRRWATRAGAVGVAAVLLAACSLTPAGSRPSPAKSTKTSSSAKASPTLTADTTGASVVHSVHVIASARALLPSSVRSKGSLVDFVNFPYPPMEMYVPGTTTPAGFDVDLAQAFGKALGLKISITNVQFPELFTGLSSGRADFVISGASDIPSRRKLYTFLDYFQTGDELQVTKADRAQYHITDGWASMCGLTVVTGTGTSYPSDVNSVSKLYCTDKGKKPIGQIEAAAMADAMVDVQTGRAQGIVDQGPEGLGWYNKTTPNSVWVAPGPVLFPNDYGVIFTKNSPLVGAFKAALTTFMHDGVYTRLLNAYGLGTEGISHTAIDAGPCECVADLLAK